MKKLGKKSTIIIFCVVGLFGIGMVLASACTGNPNWIDYFREFAESFENWFYMLVGCVGAGTIADKVVNVIKKPDNLTDSEDEVSK